MELSNLTWVEETMTDKKFTPREAALAVLKKAEELYKSSTLAKGDWKKIHDKLEREGYSKESADKIDGSIKAKMGKAEAPMQKMGMSEENPDAKADAQLGEKVEQDVQQHESQNKDSAHHEKGSYKLAKFMGKMEMKKGKPMDKVDAGATSAPAPAPAAQAPMQQPPMAQQAVAAPAPAAAPTKPIGKMM